MILGDFETGARVRRVNAKIFDFAYDRAGTVIRELQLTGECWLGVQWDGSRRIYQYLTDWEDFRRDEPWEWPMEVLRP